MNLRTLSITEAVEATGIARDTLYRLCETGQLEANRPSPRGRWRISAASLEAWVHHTPAAPAASVATSTTSDADFRSRFPELKDDERVFA